MESRQVFTERELRLIATTVDSYTLGRQRAHIQKMRDQLKRHPSHDPDLVKGAQRYLAEKRALREKVQMLLQEHRK